MDTPSRSKKMPKHDPTDTYTHILWCGKARPSNEMRLKLLQQGIMFAVRREDHGYELRVREGQAERAKNIIGDSE